MLLDADTQYMASATLRPIPSPRLTQLVLSGSPCMPESEVPISPNFPSPGASSSVQSRPPSPEHDVATRTQPSSHELVDVHWEPIPETEVGPSAVRQPSLPSLDQRIPRPRNAFMIFRAEMGKGMQRSRQANISIEAGKAWRLLTEDERKPWRDAADAESLEHKRLYPDYRYKPQRKAKKEEWESMAEEEIRRVREKYQNLPGSGARTIHRRKPPARKTPRQPDNSREAAVTPSTGTSAFLHANGLTVSGLPFGAALNIVVLPCGYHIASSSNDTRTQAFAPGAQFHPTVIQGGCHDWLSAHPPMSNDQILNDPALGQPPSASRQPEYASSLTNQWASQLQSSASSSMPYTTTQTQRCNDFQTLHQHERIPSISPGEPGQPFQPSSSSGDDASNSMLYMFRNEPESATSGLSPMPFVDTAWVEAYFGTLVDSTEGSSA